MSAGYILLRQVKTSILKLDAVSAHEKCSSDTFNGGDLLIE